jgi:hypothetical protein
VFSVYFLISKSGQTNVLSFISAGLPDITWYNITKTGKIYQLTIKYTKWPQNIPTGRKIYQHILFQDPPKFSPNWDVWFENIPSGNPAFEMQSSTMSTIKFLNLILNDSFPSIVFLSCSGGTDLISRLQDSLQPG